MWVVTKTGRSTHPFRELRNSKCFLIKFDRMGIGMWSIAFDATRFNTKSEARKALNKKYMHELTIFGDYVKLWKYGVEEITD